MAMSPRIGGPSAAGEAGVPARPAAAGSGRGRVAEGYPRYVKCGNRVTGGGISSGLDEALGLVLLIAGEEVAKDVQLSTQYYPCPPVDGSIPGATTCPLDTP